MMNFEIVSTVVTAKPRRLTFNWDVKLDVPCKTRPATRFDHLVCYLFHTHYHQYQMWATGKMCTTCDHVVTTKNTWRPSWLKMNL